MAEIVSRSLKLWFVVDNTTLPLVAPRKPWKFVLSSLEVKQLACQSVPALAIRAETGHAGLPRVCAQGGLRHDSHMHDRPGVRRLELRREHGRVRCSEEPCKLQRMGSSDDL